MKKSTQNFTIMKCQKNCLIYLFISNFDWLLTVKQRTGKNYYCQMTLKEFKYVPKEENDAWVYYWRHKNFFWFW